MTSIERLQQWYLAQCNGDWEHQFGVTIDTLDNPGWSVTIDLNGTKHQDATLETIEVRRSSEDWFCCWRDGLRFNGAGGPLNLDEILEQFLLFVSI